MWQLVFPLPGPAGGLTQKGISFLISNKEDLACSATPPSGHCHVLLLGFLPYRAEKSSQRISETLAYLILTIPFLGKLIRVVVPLLEGRKQL